MINRRHIRVKVMQSVYAMQQSHSDDLVKEEKFLKHSIQKMYDLYVLNLQLLVEVQKLARKRIELSKKKILATKEELNPNTKFIDNKLLNSLNESVSLEGYVELNKLNYWDLDDEYVKILLDELQRSDLYKKYMDTVENSYNIDKAFVIDFFRDIVAPNEKLADYFEDQMISWVDDIPFVNTWILKSLNKQKANKPFILGSLYKDNDDKVFVSDLFTKTMLHQHKYEEDIKEKTPNWEADRIADIDMIIIKMAITEFLHFPSIPSRVTINEYIELAKDYSTNKSGYFINGVLDKLAKDYLSSNKMVKIGRGLL
ncbi:MULTISPECIES: transcription antitermination factor NusB [Tenacibaculum]|uniref:Transcription antitermination factor NusB n=1 Tax=Tenacibaculum mesophilum TaxID=104268 RepID=A0AAE9MNK3_9FLAO|nr:MULTISPECIES: transcription antitermination factor NusB [Tenacibaculum]GFD83481.1 N utilization substance protein B [Tenacibaculum sp. KUL118]GFD93876.1 N utilization substance protein B [Alteromonas sp. KUL154]GFD99792.1 N utilization substance protein B [Alteromonas sp. KUL156]MCG7502898.1 transcription antitermination factor NusB [Tenacibaculum sp. Mcav3-52]MCO7186708.1 transcription antitermination factor NusB [Tenacibaculum sp. XPcli2-G]